MVRKVMGVAQRPYLRAGCAPISVRAGAAQQVGGSGGSAGMLIRSQPVSPLAPETAAAQASPGETADDVLELRPVAVPADPGAPGHIR